mgnify:CR=1 FL=1
MKNLKELEQKYLELGKEIEALKKQNIEKEEFTYPIYCKLKDSSLVVKFKGLRQGKTVVNNTFNNVGDKNTTWTSHTETNTWQQLDVCEKTGFFDGQLVWCWDNDDTHVRTLRFYDVKNKCTYQFDGTEDGHDYDNYEKFEGNYPDWAKNLLQ